MILVVGLTLYSLFVGVNSMVVRELFHNDSLDRVTLMTSWLPRTISILLSGAPLSISRECYFIFWYLSSIWFRCCSRCILLDAREFFLSRLNELPVNLFLTDFVIFYNYLCSLFLNKGFRSWFSDRIRHFLSNIPFIGIVIPNPVSLRYGDYFKKTIFPVGAFGMIFLLCADILARVLIFPFEWIDGIWTISS